MATREASQKVLNALAPSLPALVGGAADLSPSTNTLLPGSPDYSATDALGRNFHFGVREHAMVASLNGMALHGGLIPYGGTFLVFSDYCRGALRLAALQRTHVIFVFTHDSVGMGEDGPTHQPIEQLVSLRAIPGFTVIRPADANETVGAWRLALERRGPTALVFTRQKLPVLDTARFPIVAGVAPRGIRPLRVAFRTASGGDRGHRIGSVARAGRAGSTDRTGGPGASRLSALLESLRRATALVPRIRPAPGTPKVSIEAGTVLGWSRYVGTDGESIGIDRFGASAPGAVLQKEFGFTVEHVVETVDRVLAGRP